MDQQTIQIGKITKENYFLPCTLGCDKMANLPLNELKNRTYKCGLQLFKFKFEETYLLLFIISIILDITFYFNLNFILVFTCTKLRYTII